MAKIDLEPKGIIYGPKKKESSAGVVIFWIVVGLIVLAMISGN